MNPIDHIVETTPCPDCGAATKRRCTTPINGEDTGWTHDARLRTHGGARRPHVQRAPDNH